MPISLRSRDADRVGDEAGQEVLAEHLAGQLAAEVLPRPGRVHLVGAVEPLEEVRDPAGAALGQGDLDVREVLDHAGTRAGRRRPGTMFIGCRVIITSGGASAAVMASWPEEPRWTFMIVPVSDSACHSGSQYSLWKLG